MADKFEQARKALQDAQDEYNRIEQTNVSLNVSRAALEDSMDRQRQEDEEEIRSIQVSFEAKMQSARERHEDRIGKLSQEHDARYSKLESKRDELAGLVEDNKDLQQVLRPQFTANGMHVRAAAPSAGRRTSRSGLAVHQSGFGGNAASERAELHFPQDNQETAINNEPRSVDNPLMTTAASDNNHRSHTYEDSTQSHTLTAPEGYDWYSNTVPVLASTQSRKEKIPTVPSHAYIPPTNYDEPEDEDSLSAEFSLVIALNGEWHEMACHICGANAPRDRRNPGFFNGVLSLRAHIRSSHGHTQAALGPCIVQTFDWDDVRRLRDGNAPFSGQPILQNRYEKKAQ